jgi:segregation and condensation protein B
MKLKSQLEAILFLSDKPVKAAAMARIVSQDVQIVRQALLELIHDYEERDGGLEIADDDGYIIQVRDAYASIVDEFAPMEMPVALIRTLSAIAIKQPVAQSEIIKIRGAGAYDHVKELILRDLISKKEEGGRSPMLGTTKKFQEYFRLTQDAKMLRTQLVDEDRASKKAAGIGADAVEGDDGANFAPLDHEQEIAVEILETLTVAESLAAVESIESIESVESVESIETVETVASKDVDRPEERLETKIDLEKVFATSPDASFVFRPPTESKASRVARKDSQELSNPDDNAAEGSSN